MLSLFKQKKDTLTWRTECLEEQFRHIAEIFKTHLYISIYKTFGTPPDKYHLLYHLDGLQQVGKSIEAKNEHLIEISFPQKYPYAAPICKSMSPVFHPNFTADLISIDDFWTEKTPLEDLIVYIGEMIGYQKYNTDNAINNEAGKWAIRNATMLPLSSVNLNYIIAAKAVTSSQNNPPQNREAPKTERIYTENLFNDGNEIHIPGTDTKIPVVRHDEAPKTEQMYFDTLDAAQMSIMPEELDSVATFELNSLKAEIESVLTPPEMPATQKTPEQNYFDASDTHIIDITDNLPQVTESIPATSQPATERFVFPLQQQDMSQTKKPEQSAPAEQAPAALETDTASYEHEETAIIAPTPPPKTRPIPVIPKPSDTTSVPPPPPTRHIISSFTDKDQTVIQPVEESQPAQPQNMQPSNTTTLRKDGCYCPYCGAANIRNANFCTICGSRLITIKKPFPVKPLFVILMVAIPFFILGMGLTFVMLNQPKSSHADAVQPTEQPAQKVESVNKPVVPPAPVVPHEAPLVAKSIVETAPVPAPAPAEKTPATPKVHKTSRLTEAQKQEQIAMNLQNAKLYLNIGSYDDAVKRFKEVLKLDPTNYEASTGLDNAMEARSKSGQSTIH